MAVIGLAESLGRYGAPEEAVVDLRATAEVRSLPYLDLIRLIRNHQASPDGVVELRGEPLAYVLDARALAHRPEDIGRLRRLLALRNDAPYLAVLEPGRLVVHEISLSERDDIPPVKEVAVNDAEATTTFYRLHLDPEERESGSRAIETRLFDLLSKAVNGLIEDGGATRNDAVSLVGRALFVRFLVDRGVLRSEHWREVHAEGVPEHFFADSRAAADTCRWLDKTFNGDFLPLSFPANQQAFGRLRPGAFEHLTDIMHRSSSRQLRFTWADIDFAHVPVGILSQVYERQSAKWSAVQRHQAGVFYTPHRIAEYMVREAFEGLSTSSEIPLHRIRVLDPAAGGGVFLVAAFREVVRAFWQSEERMPNTSELRGILYDQLRGFDVNEPALRLAALSLYLTAIELDQHPHPLSALAFQPLRNRVLFDVSDGQDPDEGPVVGSIGTAVGKEHDGRYDLVVGNPPWTALSGKRGRRVHREMVKAVRPIAAERLGKERGKALAVPDNVPDIPFVWRAMKWCRPEGAIALALHARLLFKQSLHGQQARNDLFDALNITGILNGAALRCTPVWYGNAAPFCLLFARNERPSASAGFRLVSPCRERTLNRQGRLRIDSTAAHAVAAGQVANRPHVFKALFRGTPLDLELLERIQRTRWPSLEEYWTGLGLAASQGYQVASRRHNARHLHGLPNLTKDALPLPLVVDATGLAEFEEDGLHRPRDPAVYRGPLLLTRKSPPSTEDSPWCAHVVDTDVVYNESFYGYSAAGHHQGSRLVRYLALLLNSRVFLWHALMTSSEFGIERESVQKADIDEFPVRPLADLPYELAAQIEPLADALVVEDENLRYRLDVWAAGVFELSRWDLELVLDTLDVGLTYSSSVQRAQQEPTREESEAFISALEAGLNSIAAASGRNLSVSRLVPHSLAPWSLLRVSTEPNRSVSEVHEYAWMFELADQAGASQLIHPTADGALFIGILRQYRFWTATRARLCALDLSTRWLDVLLGDGLERR